MNGVNVALSFSAALAAGLLLGSLTGYDIGRANGEARVCAALNGAPQTFNTDISNFTFKDNKCYETITEMQLRIP